MYEVIYGNWFGIFVTATDAILYAHKLGAGAVVRRIDKTPEGQDRHTVVYSE